MTDVNYPEYGYNVMLRRAQERLQQQAAAGQAQPQEAIGGDPDHQMYGVFGPQYAAALARPTGASGGDILNRGALGLHAGGEGEAYAQALEAAGNRALAEERMRSHGVVEAARIGRTPAQIFHGETRTAPSGEYGLPSMIVDDPVTAMVGNQYRGNEMQSENVQRYGAAAKDFHEAGIVVPPETVSGQITPPTQSEPTPVRAYDSLGRNPDEVTADNQNEIDWYGALTDRYKAENDSTGDTTYTRSWVDEATGEVHTVRTRGDGSAGGGGGGGGAPGQPTPQQQRKIEQVQRHGAQVSMQGDVLIVLHQGRQYAYGPDGQLLQGGAPPGGVQ